MDSEKKDYIIKEAEAIIAECVKNIGKSSNIKTIIKKDKVPKKKYKISKTSIAGAIIIIETIVCIILATK